MPRINVRNVPLSNAGNVNVRADANAFGAQVGNAISGFGAELGRIKTVSDAKASKEKTVADAKATKLEKERLNNEAITQIHRYRALSKENDALFVKDNPNSTQKDRAANFDQFTKDYQTNNEFNAVASKSFQTNIIDLKSVVTLDAIRKDSVRSVELQIDSIDQTGQSLINTVITDPSQLQDSIKEYHGLLSSNTMLKESVRQDKLTKFVQDATAASFASRLDKDNKSYNPQQVSNDLRSGMFDNMLSSSAKETLSAKATIKSDEQTFTQNVSDLQASFPNLEDRLRYLTHTNAGDMKKRFNLKAGNAMRIASDTRSNIMFNRNQANIHHEAVKTDTMRQISDLYKVGDIKGADELTRNSEVFPSLIEQNRIRDAMRAESSHNFDPEVFHNAEIDISLGVMQNESEIGKLITSSNNKDILRKQLNEYKANAGHFNFFKAGMADFDALQKKFKNIDANKSKLAAIVLSQARRQGIGPFDDRMSEIFNKLLSQKDGTGGIFSRNKFGIEGQQQSVDQSNLPSLDAIQAEIERRNMK